MKTNNQAHIFPADNLLPSLAARAAAENISDVHIKNGGIFLRRLGKLEKLDKILTPAESDGIFSALLRLIGRDGADFAKGREAADFPLYLGEQRARAHIYLAGGSPALALRFFAPNLPAPAALGLGGLLDRLSSVGRGLVLATGATGSGKTTTLAALAAALLARKPRHLVTLEDPIEIVLTEAAGDAVRQSLVSQREKGTDFAVTAQGIREALRERPDILLIGEIRNAADLAGAIGAAETGVLVLASLHAPTAAEAAGRAAALFPPAERGIVLESLAAALEAVISQTLLPTADGGMAAASELLIATPPVRNLIRTNKLDQLPSAQMAGKAAGMRTRREAIGELVRAGRVSPEALEKFDRAEKLRQGQ